MGIQIRLLKISSLVKTARVIKQVKANVAVKNETVKYSINFLDPFDVSWALYLYAASIISILAAVLFVIARGFHIRFLTSQWR